MSGDSALRAVEITADNVGKACRVAVRPDQEGLVAPVAWSLAEAYASPHAAWPRLIMRDDTAVGFVMASFDPSNEIPAFRCGIWRLNVAADAQGAGVGRYAVGTVLDEARRRGHTTAYVLWVDKPGTPEPFYLRMGFRRTGEILFDEVVGSIEL